MAHPPTQSPTLANHQRYCLRPCAILVAPSIQAATDEHGPLAPECGAEQRHGLALEPAQQAAQLVRLDRKRAPANLGWPPAALPQLDAEPRHRERQSIEHLERDRHGIEFR